jgi:hypothetical protein
VALVALVCVQQLLLTKRFATVLIALAPKQAGYRQARLRELLVDQQVGTAYNMVLPSNLGGDVIRAMRAHQHIGSAAGGAAAAWGAVLLDRLLGLLALVLVPLLGLLIDSARVPSVLLRTALLLALLLVPSVVFAGRLFRLFSTLVARRWPSLGKLAADIARVLDATSPAMCLRALGWSFVYQLSVSAFFHIAADSFGIPMATALPAIWIGLPLTYVLSTLPITIGGLGLRESLFVGILGLYAVSPAQALALSIVWSGQGLLTAGAGVIAVWCEKTPGAAARAT